MSFKGILAGKKLLTRGQADSTGVPPYPKVNKAEELTYLSTNIGVQECYPLR